MIFSKKLLCLILIIICSAGVCSAEKTVASPNHRVVKVGDELSSTELAAARIGREAIADVLEASRPKSIVPDMVSFAKRFLGKRYRRGAKGPNAFDCSGFTSYVFKEFGYALNPSSGSQFTQGVKLGRDEVMPGDLLFFSGRRAGSTVGHVAIAIDVNPADGSIKFIHATIGGGVKIDTYPDGGYYSKRFIGARRVLSDEDFGLSR